MRRIGATLDPFFAHADALCGAVAALEGIGSGTVQLHKLRIIHVPAEGALDCL